MTNQKHKLKQCPFGTLAFRQLWAYSKGKRRTMKTQLPAQTRKRMESSLKRCSTNQHPESDKDTACNQMETNMNGQLNPGTVPAATRTESSLKRCQANDTAFSQDGKDTNDKMKTSRLSAAAFRRKVEDARTRFNEYRKMKSCGAFQRSLCLKYGICNSRATLIENVEENGGELRLALSPIAVKLYKDGTSVASAVTTVGIQRAFASVINFKSTWVTLRVKYGKLSISKE